MAKSERKINPDQIKEIFRAMNHDPIMDKTVARYSKRNKIPQSPSIRAAFMWAVLDFLVRSEKDQAAAYRDDAETLENALALFKRDENENGSTMFSRLMVGNGEGGSGIQKAGHALWAIQQMAVSFRYAANTHLKILRSNTTFFYCIGLRLTAEAKLPKPSPGEALLIFNVLVDKIKEVAPSFLEDVKTAYHTNEGDGSEIRRLIKAGGRKLPKKRPYSSP